MKKGLATCSGRATINVLDLDAMLNCERFFFAFIMCEKNDRCWSWLSVLCMLKSDV